jgi:hypothetical protein
LWPPLTPLVVHLCILPRNWILEIEPLTENLSSGVVALNHAYYWDGSQTPFEVLHQKEVRKKQRINAAEVELEENLEISEYEKMRAARVARNKERLQALGLA